MKGTTPMANYQTARTTPQEADQLEVAMKGQRLTLNQEIAVWDIWEKHGLVAAQHVLTSIKEARNPARLRTKDIPVRTKSGNATLDELTRALEAVAERMDRSNFDAYARPLIQQANQVAAQLDQANRAAGQRIGMGALFDEGMKSLGKR
jgi:hypothetical protein